MYTKEDYIRALQREGWEVSDVTLNEEEFTQIVTTAAGVAATSSDIITIQPPSGSEVHIPKGSKVWVYIGGGAANINDNANIRVLRERADGDVNKIDSGVYVEFNRRDEETVHRFKRNTIVLPAHKLKIQVTPDIATTTAGTKFALDCLILQKKV